MSDNDKKVIDFAISTLNHVLPMYKTFTFHEFIGFIQSNYDISTLKMEFVTNTLRRYSSSTISRKHDGITIRISSCGGRGPTTATVRIS